MFIFAAGVRTQSSLEGSQHNYRQNRVWSLRIAFNVCGIEIDSARMARIEDNGDLAPWQQVNPQMTIIQWSHFLPLEFGDSEATYGIFDLLADYGQTIYVLHLIGHSETTGGIFTKIFWVSPVGLSSESIPKAPIRSSKATSKWTEEDSPELIEWIEMHTWSRNIFLREFRFLLRKTDRKLDLPVRFATKDCDATTAGNLQPR